MNLSCYIHRNPLRARLVKRLVDYRWSSYPSYAYNKVEPKWIYKKLVLSRIAGRSKSEKKERYRKKVQAYSGEESRLFENLMHGLLLGSEKFINMIKDKYLTDKVDNELTQRSRIKKEINFEKLLRAASKILKCDLETIRKKTRVTKELKTKRNLLLYCLWSSGRLTNIEIGKLFNISYSSVGKQSKLFIEELDINKNTRRQLNKINSLFQV